MLANFKIAETDNFQQKISSRDFKALYKKISDYIYPQLRENPFFGSNIKKLKGKWSDIYRYRVGYYRIFYTIDSERRILFVFNIDKRKDAYRKK